MRVAPSKTKSRWPMFRKLVHYDTCVLSSPLLHGVKLGPERSEGDYLAHVTFFAEPNNHIKVMILRLEWYKILYDTSVLSSPLHGVIGPSLRSGPNFTPCNNGLLKARVS